MVRANRCDEIITLNLEAMIVANRLPFCTGVLLLALTSGGWIHGSTPPPPTYPNWREALANVPCHKILNDGPGEVKVIGPVMIDGKIYIDHVVEDEDEIEAIGARCHFKG